MKIEVPLRRILLFVVLFLALISILGFRLLRLHFEQKDFLSEQGKARFVRTVKIPTSRGMMLDRRGSPLAVSTPIFSVFVNPKKFQATTEQMKSMIKLLGLEPSAVKRKLQSYKNRSFMYIKRHIEPMTAEKIQALKIEGLFLKQEFRRFYPTGEVSSQIVGFTNIDDIGQTGLELAYNHWLEGKEGLKRIIRNRLGQEVEDLEHIRSVKLGRDLLLSLDSRLQYLAYQAIKKAVNKNKAHSGSVVVLDIPTGEVLAMVNYPSFNPNARHKPKLDKGYANRAVTFTFEPGSCMKPMSLACVLEHRIVKSSAKINTSPGVYKLKGGIVRDERDLGTLDLAGILRYSSNVGVSKLALALPEGALEKHYRKLGFGSSTGSGFPGEQDGSILPIQQQKDFVLATLSFGYGISVTPLQLAEAYAILGAQGLKKPISFIKQEKLQPAERVLSQKTSTEVVRLLEEVVANGSGFRAKVSGYRIAGKTGTARKLKESGYDPNAHVAFFAGIAPASHPRFAIVTLIDEPTNDPNEYYGSQLAAPVFSKIAEGALRLYAIPMDKPPKEGKRTRGKS